MSDTIITVENLGKKYIIGHQQQEKYTALRDVIANGAKGLFKSFQNRKFKSSNYQEEFWALKDVSFEIKQGDRVGIIGRNGAGKSTLLKILSRITEPTQGNIKIKGRVASLLEVGTGFHPELTGRENIYLNGAILGMSKAEIKQKFDEIVAFAEVEKFLDTPVKRYSSGMYVRLAFAVAAHLEPEILVVDEVLAVGDVEFQKKCLGKMQDVAQGGRTVLFVSHNMAAVRQLCNSALLMKNGSLVFEGSAELVVNHYLNATQSKPLFSGVVSRYGIALNEVLLQDRDTGDITYSPIFNGNYLLKLKLHGHDPLSDTAIVVRIYDAMGSLVSSICSVEEGIPPFLLKQDVEVIFTLATLKLFPGQYRASFFVYRPNDPVCYLEAEDALVFEVNPSIVNEAMWPYRSDHGVVRIANYGSVVYL
ncbi:ATP-binding cassette domain-containing protein [Nostoc sp. FACHB-87]|uniref:ABC transporter ATP-binding protein n=2 Tax=Cyanophyceae TaxID=3028117 RepID=UPI0016892EA0|nr:MULTISPECIES: polysaccharide ABC transporter ATP-binding protein [Nostocales]MBD2452907.1 ATP-binding cassette domain-containing protein [Nostoc sp. FACHB-87]MBD2473838.1 ATP-binding cassette domain-containing protein [Anabaena sp. FACHB-83]MBD2491115.1 ATP-binding cassette domain-containing protein [Aulosira sp. FACHB-615]